MGCRSGKAKTFSIIIKKIEGCEEKSRSERWNWMKKYKNFCYNSVPILNGDAGSS